MVDQRLQWREAKRDHGNQKDGEIRLPWRSGQVQPKKNILGKYKAVKERSSRSLGCLGNTKCFLTASSKEAVVIPFFPA